MPQTFIHYFDRYLKQLDQEIRAYPDEAQLWQLAGDISNTPGNLCLHLIGNLNHFIGHALGDTAYVRNRPLEFSEKSVPRATMLERLTATRSMLAEVLKEVKDLDADYPKGLFPEEGSVRYQLLRLLTHLAYHVGQINYHRRLLASSSNP